MQELFVNLVTMYIYILNLCKKFCRLIRFVTLQVWGSRAEYVIRPRSTLVQLISRVQHTQCSDNIILLRSGEEWM